MSEVLTVHNLVKHFHLDKDSYIGAVNDVSFTLKRGETLGLVGESGSGKTTVGRCVLRLVEHTSGEILFMGEDISKLAGPGLRKMRARMQLVFQDPFGSLNPRLSVGRTIEEPLLLHMDLNATQRRDRVNEILKQVDLSPSVLDLYPISLTASEQQRVGVARALVTKPSLVVLDEPTSMLDPTVRSDLLDVLAQSQKEHGTSYIFISHDLEAVQKISTRIAILYLGRLLEVADAAEMMSTQNHPYSRALLASVLHPDPFEPLQRTPIRGEIPSAVNPPDQCPFLSRCPVAIDVCKGRFPKLEKISRTREISCYRFAQAMMEDTTLLGEIA